MKTKLTLLKNALLVGCAMFALTSCSDDDSLDYTTYDCAGTYSGSLTIREHGSGANGKWLNGSSLSYSAVLLDVTAVSATQLKYQTDSVATVPSTWGYQIDVTVDYVSDGVDMKYFTASGAEYTVDSLIVDEDDASIQYHTYTKYTNCDVLAHAKPLGVRLEIRGGQGNYQGGLVTYSSSDKQLGE